MTALHLLDPSSSSAQLVRQAPALVARAALLGWLRYPTPEEIDADQRACRASRLYKVKLRRRPAAFRRRKGIRPSA